MGYFLSSAVKGLGKLPVHVKRLDTSPSSFKIWYLNKPVHIPYYEDCHR